MENTGERAARLEKLAALRELGADPYGHRFPRTHRAVELHTAFGDLEGSEVAVAGRIMAYRGHGKAAFADLQDLSGRVQLHLREDVLGERGYRVAGLLDLGDLVGVRGRLFRTRRGEVTVEVVELTVLAKSLAPLPEKRHGLQDVDRRYRQRYLDLVGNEDSRRRFLQRSRILRAIRGFLDERGFLEVETPVMQVVASGAAARPFVTHHNALDLDLHLRIALELPLKRLIVGGLEQVYEIGRVFRNEGISPRHNPEFTLLELYQAYADYTDMMSLTEELVAATAREVLGSTVLTYQGQTIDLTPPWPRLSLLETVRRYSGVDFRDLADDAAARTAARERGLEPGEGDPWGKVLDLFFEAFVAPQLVQPCFLLDYPRDVSPLAKAKEDDPSLTYRFEAVIAGREIANAFSELNDPGEQRERFRQQLTLREGGDAEAQALDEDFLNALEQGMPPTGGLGIGIDRLVMLLTDAPSIKDVILFPLMRPLD